MHYFQFQAFHQQYFSNFFIWLSCSRQIYYKYNIDLCIVAKLLATWCDIFQIIVFDLIETYLATFFSRFKMFRISERVKKIKKQRGVVDKTETVQFEKRRRVAIQ